jgi:hypothetical protein
VTSAYGQKGVRDLLAALGHNVTITGTLRDGLDVDVDEFEGGWQAWLRERYGD